MTTFENDLERQLEGLAQAADPAGQVRVMRGVKRADRNRRLGKVAAFAMGVAVAAGAVLVLNGSGGGGRPGERKCPAGRGFANGTANRPRQFTRRENRRTG